MEELLPVEAVSTQELHGIGLKEYAVGDLVVNVIELLRDPGSVTWLNVAFLIERGKNAEEALQGFNLSARRAFLENSGNIQAALSSKATPEISDRPKIVEFVEMKMEKKRKINCLGNALAGYLIASANSVPCSVHASSTHSWIVLDSSGSSESNTANIVDAIDNIKMAKRVKKPLSIYTDSSQLDNFALCLLIVVNDNALSDEEEFQVLHHYKDRLKHSWELIKYFTLGVTLKKCDINLTLLDAGLCRSLDFAFARTSYYICELENTDLAFVQLTQCLDLVEEHCEKYEQNVDLWLYSDGSLLKLSQEFVESFSNNNRDVSVHWLEMYESWIDRAVVIANKYVPSAAEKFRKVAPTMNGKRRRVAKDIEI